MATTPHGRTLLELLDTGNDSHPAIRVPGGPDISYASLRTQVAALAEELQALGIHLGDRVATILPHSAEGVVIFLAAATAGAAAPLNPAYKSDECRFYLEDTRAKALITPPDGAEAALDVLPEGSMHLVASMNSEGEVSLYVMPLFHVHGLVASTLATLGSGGTVVVPGRFNPMNFWPLVKGYDVTWYSAVPAMHKALLARARSGGSRNDPTMYSSLRFIRSCSAPLPPETMREMEERFGAPVLEAYGMTEASHQMASNPLPPAARAPGTVGLARGAEIGIMDVDGTLLAEGEQGEVVVRGDGVITAYEDNAEANATSFVEGWFRTGDEGVLDAGGYLRLVGRIKELINRSGEKISPVEIDHVLLSHDAVAEAVAFGVPHPTHGEEPSAAVVLNGEATEADLVRHCKEHLADFKAPRTIHIVGEIPKTATGKVQRRLVADAFTREAVSV